jgi:hypothetical protein
MSKPDRIKIDDQEYVRSESNREIGNLSLVILNRGWMYVGVLGDDGCSMTNVHNLRSFKNVGMSVTISAKSASAVLDKCTDVRWPSGSEIAIHELPKGWFDV